MDISIENGKYRYVLGEYKARVLRYDEPWKDVTGDKFIYCMAAEIESLRQQLAAALAACEAKDAAIESLWAIIDDIDTYGDMAKSDDKAFRALVERRQKDRWKTGITTDGFTLTIPIQPDASALP